MELKYAAFNTAVALKAPFSKHARRRRMQLFLNMMRISGGERIIDLGGTVNFWNEVTVPLDITVLNLPGEASPEESQSPHRLRIVEGDACDVDFAQSGSFDIAFSNSVIEHVGGLEKRRRLATEAMRLAPRYWVQTPAIWFPIEAHTHMPFWWFYPPALKDRFVRGWTEKLPAWTEMVKGTTVIMRSELAELFPDAEILTERFMGVPKSYIAARHRQG